MSRRTTRKILAHEMEQATFLSPHELSVAPTMVVSDDMARAYKINEEVGRGGQGIVLAVDIFQDQKFEGFERAVESAVMKVSNMPHALAREEEVYRRSDRGIVKLLDSGTIEANEQGMTTEKPYLVLERLYPHPFARYLASVDLATAIDTFVNLLEILADLHAHPEMPIVLCDIKPDNIMLRMSNKEGQIDPSEYIKRLALGAYEPVFMDVGCAQHAGQLAASAGRIGEMIGTPMYLPPESVPDFDGQTVIPGVYSPKTDVYALTLTFYEYLTRDRIYKRKGLYKLKGEQRLLELIAFKREGISPVDERILFDKWDANNAKDLQETLAMGLHPDPAHRASARDLYEHCIKTFKVSERWLKILGEYRFDAVKGVRMWQNRFKRFEPAKLQRYFKSSSRTRRF